MRLDYEIKPGEGIGPFTLGLSTEEILNIANGTLIDHGVSSLFSMDTSTKYQSYGYTDSINLTVNLSTDELVKIIVREQYIGKYKSVFGVGNTVADLYAIRRDLTFDDTYVIVGEPEEMVVMLDVDNIRSIESVMHEVCEAIIIEKVGWIHESKKKR
jgi:hypothetical protein